MMTKASLSQPPIIRIANATFYRHHPCSGLSHPNPPLFSQLSLEIPSFLPSSSPHNWCVVGPSLSGKTTLLHALRGRLLCEPPTARSFPYLATDAVSSRLKTPSRAIQYVGFDSDQNGLGGGGGATSTYLSARYESRREITDWSVRDFLLGNTQLNPSQKLPGEEDANISPEFFNRVATDLGLNHLLNLPVTFLSNGQGRRARIAHALLRRPEVLLLDEPFMGLDPPTVKGLSPLLESLAAKANPRLILSARPQDPLPEWITHLVYLRTDCQVAFMGPKDEVLDGLKRYVQGVKVEGLDEDPSLPLKTLVDIGRTIASQPSSTPKPTNASHTFNPVDPDAEVLVDMQGVKVCYGEKAALGNWVVDTPSGSRMEGLQWTVRRGERWGVFGPNGSGKTTIVSLLCSDHPQTYSLPIKLFGRSRLPEPGKPSVTFWDIQARIGHSSPEVHQHLPKRLTIRQVVENAWASTFLAIPKLDSKAKQRVDAALRWFAPELCPVASAESVVDDDDLKWADEYMFGGVSFSAQRVALFIRSMIKSPDIVVLDEAFSGMDDAVREKCAHFLTHGDGVDIPGLSKRQALICIAHIKEEVPSVVREWMCLPEANTGRPARFGRLDGPVGEDEARWHSIWDSE